SRTCPQSHAGAWTMSRNNQDQRSRLRAPVTPWHRVACPLLGVVAPCRICSSASGRCPNISDRATIMWTLSPNHIVRTPSPEFLPRLRAPKTLSLFDVGPVSLGPEPNEGDWHYEHAVKFAVQRFRTSLSGRRRAREGAPWLDPP